MEEEVAELKKDMQIEETVEMAGMVFCKGTLGGKEVVIVRSGIGKVNAGICAQILVSQFGADTLINTGIAGSLDAQIDIGDMVISTDALHHDMDATVFGDPAGQIPRMDTLSFPADKELVKKAVAANEKANPDIHTFTGRVASGDQFISDKEVKERIVSLFHPMCVEMEGAGIAQAAYLNKVSYVIIRAISDKAVQQCDNGLSDIRKESNRPQCKAYERIASDDLRHRDNLRSTECYRICTKVTESSISRAE